MTLTHFAALVLIASCALAMTQKPPAPTVTPAPTTLPPFLLYGHGPTFTNPPAGYELATLATLQSEEFIDYYNDGGLLDQGESFYPLKQCCVFYTAAGYLTVGSPVSYLGPYFANGTFQCNNVMTNPVFLGTNDAAGQYNNTFIWQLDHNIVSQFNATATYGDAPCPPGASTLAIYQLTKLPVPYLLYGHGSTFNSPPAGYELASLSDVKTERFINFYNRGGLTDLGESFYPLKQCCVFYTKSGFLTLGSPASYLGPYFTNGTFQCNNVMTNPVLLGTNPGVGQFNGVFIWQLDEKLVNSLTATPTYGDAPCPPGGSTLAIYKQRDL